MSLDAHVYRYREPSELGTHHGRAALRLATSGGAEANPHFFDGALTRPRQTALALRGLSRVVGARYFTPPAMLGKILLQSDPVITCGRGMLRFEGFSACASAYARVDLTEQAYAGEAVGFGTTNVDFNAEMRAALANVRDGEPLGLRVGGSQVVLHQAGSDVIERKVPLPTRWLKGFVEVQAYLSRMTPFVELDGVQALRFLRTLPRGKSGRTAFFLAPQRGSLRLSATPGPGTLQVTGLERLRTLEDLAPQAQTLRIFGDAQSQASAWELDFGALRITLALSPSVWRGFSGEGQALGALVRGGEDAVLIQRLRAELRWQSTLDEVSLAQRLEASPAEVRDALHVLGTRGLVGFDQRLNTWFHRELPFDLQEVEALSPRLTAARELLTAGAVTPLSASAGSFRVTSGDVVHEVVVDRDGQPVRCTCPWVAQHGTSRGPCKHQLAAQLHLEESGHDGE